MLKFAENKECEHEKKATVIGSGQVGATVAIEMAESILKDKKKILPCAVLLEGEYGIHNLFMGVPVKRGSSGLEQIIEIELTEEERKALDRSANAVQKLVDDMKRLS